jgi:hypothetical protein
VSYVNWSQNGAFMKLQKAHMKYHSLDLGRIITPLLKYFINGNGDYIKVAQIARLSSESLEIFKL